MPVIASGSLSPNAPVQTFSDIYTEILNKMRQPLNQPSITEQAKRYVNTGLQDMVFGFEYKLPWLERNSFITTMAPYTTGTVVVARGSTTVTGTNTLWTTANVYNVNNARTSGKLSFGGGDIYTISTVDGAGTITMHQRYVAGEDLAAGSSYTYFEDEYALPSDFLKPIDYQCFSQALNIPIVGRNDFRRMYPSPRISGAPTVATILDKAFTTTSTQPLSVQFYPYPSTNLIIPYTYITKNLAVSSTGTEAAFMSADTDEPQLPLRYRNALVSFAIAKWYRDKKDDTRAEAANNDYMTEVTRIVNDQRIGANTTMQITPKVGLYGSRPYSGSRTRFSTNNSFDNFRT